MTTKTSLNYLAHNAPEDVAYWRVLRPKGELFANYPGGLIGHAAHLEDEGFAIETEGKSPKVKDYKDKIVQFG